jgi:hypothetical protein
MIIFALLSPFSGQAAYQLFLLRALLEFFKDILNKVNGRLAIYFCTPNRKYANFNLCLSDMKAKNDENIQFIDQWFASNSSVFGRGKWGNEGN